jgi:hypothetical protein
VQERLIPLTPWFGWVDTMRWLHPAAPALLKMLVWDPSSLCSLNLPLG